MENWLDHALAQPASGLWFLAVFVAGLALNLTPCVYPMLPVTIAFFSGQTKGRRAHLLLLGLSYVGGMSLTYAALGFAAAKTGALLGSWLQQPLVLIGIAALIAALALGMFGLYELRPPAWVAQRLGQAPSGVIGAFVMGLAVGVIAAPCVGPFILSLILFIGKLADPALGFWLLFVMGLGMGLPFLLIGLLANRLAQWPKAGPWLVWIKRALGVVLLGLSLYYVRPLLAPLRSLTASPAPAATVAWRAYAPETLERAREAKQPVIIDVYADWCLPCVELDHVTFRNPQVVQRLSGFVTLRIDATRAVPAEAQPLLDRYGIIGVPMVLLFDADGRERPELRASGFVSPAEMLARLDHLSGS